MHTLPKDVIEKSKQLLQGYVTVTDLVLLCLVYDIHISTITSKSISFHSDEYGFIDIDFTELSD